MHMTFFWTTDLGEFFLPGLNVNGVLPLALACLVAGILSIVYEGIKVHSATVRARSVREQIAAVSCAPSETNLLVTDHNNSKTSFSDRFCKMCNEAIVFLFHNSIGYIIMLSCMVYSGWLFIAVVLSMGLGYFMFGHISMKINMENVQARTNTVICVPACVETGENGDVSKNPSPCRSISAQVNQQQSPALPTVSCHQYQEKPSAPPAVKTEEEDEDCCCRL